MYQHGAGVHASVLHVSFVFAFSRHTGDGGSMYVFGREGGRTAAEDGARSSSDDGVSLPEQSANRYGNTGKYTYPILNLKNGSS